MKKDYLGANIPKLGFGLMRLPQKGGQVDMEQTIKMVDLFMERGFSYFDTAYVYHDGKSEVVAREALVKRYPRDRFQLATKLAQFNISKPEQMETMFQTSLDRAGVTYFDFYLIHGIGADAIPKIEKMDMWGFIAEKKRQGKARHIGFSFHDTADVLDKVLTDHPEAEFVQLQLNYADWESESVQSRQCYEVAMRHNTPVIVMEPVKGGSLVTMAPNISQPLRDYAPDASLASWAIRFCASLDGVVTVLSGMSNLDQVNDNTTVMRSFKPLDARERAVLLEVNRLLGQVVAIPCTQCRYCVPECPQNINIPELLMLYNNYLTYKNLTAAKRSYGNATSEGSRASDCIACGQCESICPQHIGIIGHLQEIAELLE